MTFNDQVKALNEMLENAEPKRLQRAVTRQVAEVIDLCEGTVITGTSGTFHPTITVMDSYRAFRCDCPDKAKRGHTIGPCKHVLALAYEATLNAAMGRFDRKAA